MGFGSFCFHWKNENSKPTKVKQKENYDKTKKFILHSCNQCGYESELKNNAIKHQQQNHMLIKRNDRGRITCGECSVLFATSADMKRHFMSHTRHKDRMSSKSYHPVNLNRDVTLVKTEDNLVLNSNLEIDLQIEQMIEKNEGLWHCKVCGKTNNYESNMKQHAETHIEGVSHTCHICNKTFSTRKSLKVHIGNSHSELSFNCPVCIK